MSNLLKVLKVAKSLGPLREDFVFVGGAVIELNLDQSYRLKQNIRPTYDVDTIVEVVGLGSYAKLEKKLRSLGFKNNPEAEGENSIPPICRFQIDNLAVDVMPTDPNILGFGNRWYQLAFKNSLKYTLGEGVDIFLVSAPYMMATKMEAFLGRGNNDYFHHDMEDMITLIDGRGTLVDEIREHVDIKAYLREHFEMFLKDDDFHVALDGHLAPYGARVPARSKRVISLLRDMVQEG